MDGAAFSWKLALITEVIHDLLVPFVGLVVSLLRLDLIEFFYAVLRDNGLLPPAEFEVVAFVAVPVLLFPRLLAFFETAGADRVPIVRADHEHIVFQAEAVRAFGHDPLQELTARTLIGESPVFETGGFQKLEERGGQGAIAIHGIFASGISEAQIAKLHG